MHRTLQQAEEEMIVDPRVKQIEGMLQSEAKQYRFCFNCNNFLRGKCCQLHHAKGCVQGIFRASNKELHMHDNRREVGWVDCISCDNQKLTAPATGFCLHPVPEMRWIRMMARIYLHHQFLLDFEDQVPFASFAPWGQPRFQYREGIHGAFPVKRPRITEELTRMRESA